MTATPPTPSAPAKEHAGNVLAAIASFVLPGLGQLAQGRFVPALICFVLTVGLWLVLLGWVMHVIAAADAALFNQKSAE